jgi:hypothetical protein
MMKKITSSLAITAIVAFIALAGYQVSTGNISVAQASDACNSASDLSATVTGSVTSKTVTITNNSTSCTYSVGIASYQEFADNITTQVIFDSKTASVDAGKSVTLSMNAPSCASQDDVFIGSVIQTFSGGARYGSRLISTKDTSSQPTKGDFCTVPPPPPPAPTVTGSCSSSNTPEISVSWSDASQGTSGYHIDITSNADFTNGGWYETVATGITSANFSSFSGLSAFGNAPGDLTLTSGGTYQVRIYYVSSGAHTSAVTVNVPNCVPNTPPPVTATCAASANPVNVGDSVTWTAAPAGGNGTYTYSWSGSNGLSGSSQSESDSYSSAGTQNATVVVTSGGQSVTANCTTVVNQTTYSNLAATCSASANPVNVGDSVTWTANPTGGNGNYTYSWSGTGGLYGNSQSESDSYSSAGNQTATVVVTSADGQSVTANCNTQVNQTTYSNLSVTCNANTSNANIGDTVTWNSSPTGGNGNYTYSWSGTDGLSGSSQSTSDSYSYSGTKYATITVTSGDGETASAQCQTQVNQNQVYSNLSATCSANTSNANVGNTVTWTVSPSGGNGNYTYSWSGSNNLSGYSSQTSSQYYSTGQQNAEVAVTSNGQTVYANCYTNINQQYVTPPPQQPAMFVTCSATPSSVLVGQNVTWNSFVNGGSGYYNYSWSGTDNLGNSGSQAVTTSYSTPGQKQATVTVSSNGITLSQTCTIYVSAASVAIAPISPIENSGGGVYLSQVPYTGIGSNLKIILFALGLLVWSSVISYILIKRKAEKNGMTVAELISGPTQKMAFAGSSMPIPTMGSSLPNAATVGDRISALKAKMQKSIPVMQTMPRGNITLKPYEPKGTLMSSAVVASVMAATPANLPTDSTFKNFFMVGKPEAEVEAAEVAIPVAELMISHETILTSLEKKARDLETLVSADALELIAKASGNNKHNALIILTNLVEIYAGTEVLKGDWLVLNAEKINGVLASSVASMTPVFVSWLVAGDERKSLAYMRMLQMQGKSVQSFVAGIAREFANTHAYRMEGEGTVSSTILNLTASWTDEELEDAVSLLSNSVNDDSIKAAYSTIKIAVMKVLEMSNAKIA